VRKWGGVVCHMSSISVPVRPRAWAGRARSRGSNAQPERNDNMSRIGLRMKRRCLRCPLRAPSGRCLAPGRKSGRCGDWVWYMRGRKQWRHLYVRPKDPCTPKQLHWRARFSATSKKYSHSLTEEQHRACIAAGAKLRSRPRLSQSGPLTGQQYSIRKQYAADTASRAQSAEKPQKGLQTQAISLSTSDPRQGISGVPPGQRRWDTRRASRSKSAKKNKEGGKWKAMAASELLQPHRLTRSGGVRYRHIPRAALWQGASYSGRFPVPGRPSVRTSPNLSRPLASPGSRRRLPSPRRGGWLRSQSKKD